MKIPDPITVKDLRSAFEDGAFWQWQRGFQLGYHMSEPHVEALARWPDPLTIREEPDPAYGGQRWRYTENGIEVYTASIHNKNAEWRSPDASWLHGGVQRQSERFALWADLAARPYRNSAGEPVAGPSE